MIIPIRCFTCNKVLGDKWNYYKNRVREMEDARHQKSKGSVDDGQDTEPDVTMRTSSDRPKEPRGELLDEMGLTRMCCRRHMLTHVDLIDIL